MKYEYSYSISRSLISYKSIGRRICPLSTKITSSSLSSNYRKKRLDAARLLIAEGRLSATHISELLHDSTVYAFSKAFKQEYGVCIQSCIAANKIQDFAEF